MRARLMMALLLLGGLALAQGSGRKVEAVFTSPWCDVCSPEDKAALQRRSAIVARVVGLIDGAKTSVDAAQFTFSVAEIEAALLRAHQRGVKVRLALDAAQDAEGSVGRRLRDKGVPVRFVAGKARAPAASPSPEGEEFDRGGLQHAKFLLVDGVRLANGSNNWSSTGTTINEETTLVVESTAEDPLLRAYACHFEAIWAADVDRAGACSVPGLVAFTPGTAPIGLIKEGLRGAKTSVDVLMHHLTFDKLVDELMDAARRGVRVRVVVNAADAAEVGGRYHDRLAGAGVQVRLKRGNAALHQLQHNKLAIVDGKVLLFGSGNWSGSALFNNFENYTRYEDAALVGQFSAEFERIWSWSLPEDALVAKLEPADLALRSWQLLRGNLHAHIAAGQGSARWDDGKAERKDASGAVVAVPEAAATADPARYAFTYARDQGKLDFLALTPHTVDGVRDPPDLVSMDPGYWARMRETAKGITASSGGRFLALVGMEWNTNGEGNHVGVFGASALAVVPRGRFDLLYGQFLPQRVAAGDRPVLMLCHPKTLPERPVTLEDDGGNWDIPRPGDLAKVTKASSRQDKLDDYGLDDVGPLKDRRASLLAGSGDLDAATLHAALGALAEVTAPWARLIEVTLGRGAEIGGTEAQNPSLVTEGGATVRQTRVDDWHVYLLGGMRLAPVANHDNHYANWGTGHRSRTGVWVERRDEAGFQDALLARRVFASEDPGLSVALFAEGRVPMGSELRTAGAKVGVQLLVTDEDYAGPYEIRWMRGRVGGDAVELAAQGSSPGRSWARQEIALPSPGVWFVYAEIREPGPDAMAWTAPVWIDRTDSVRF